MTSLKHSHAVEGAALIEQIADWTATGVLSQILRLATQRRAYNIVITNVPGPPIELYLLGARMHAPYPMVPLFENQAVGIALFSYAGGLFWGCNADWDSLPDLHDFVGFLGEEFDALTGLARNRSAA